MAMAKMMVNGYMSIRWYQQSEQGSYPLISEKYKLPNVAINPAANAKNNAFSRLIIFYKSSFCQDEIDYNQ